MIINFNYFVSGNQLVIVGGWGPSGSLSSVEALDEHQHLNCNIPSYPIVSSVHSSTVTSSGILVCGGSYGSRYRNDCYEYRSSSNSWTSLPSMMTERYYFDMIDLKEKVYAVGGLGGSGSYNSMESYDSSTRIWTKQSLPFSVWGHCITQLSENKFILIAGNSGSVVSKNVMTKNISIQQFHFLHFNNQNIFKKTVFFKF